MALGNRRFFRVQYYGQLLNKELKKMSKNIQTHNAKIDLVKKFLDYANCADVSYAFLKYILYSIL